MSAALRLAVVLLSAVSTAAAPSWGAVSQEGSAASVSADQRESALQFDPSTLPRAGDARWRDWSAATPPPDEVRATFVAGARAYQEGDYATTTASPVG